MSENLNILAFMGWTKAVAKSIQMETQWVGNHEKWVPGVTGELPREIPGPPVRKRRAKVSKKVFVPPRPGDLSWTQFLTKSIKHIFWKVCFGDPYLAHFV